MSTQININKRISVLEESAQITPDVNSINFTGDGVTATAVGNDVTVNIPGAYGITTYYLNESVTQAPYKEFSSVPTAAAEQTISTAVLPTATVTLQSFQTPVGIPNTTNIPGGRWAFYVHFSGTLGNAWTIFAEVYIRDLASVETLVLTTDAIPTSALSGTPTMILTDGIFPTTTTLTTDRIVVKIKATNNDPVNTNTITFHTEGSTNYSIGTTTLNQAIVAGTVTSVTGTAPIVSSGGSTPAISIPKATALVDGYLDNLDWVTFNGKQDPISLTTTGTSGASTFIANVLNIPQYQGALTLTTVGVSGLATLIGNTLNIPGYTLAGLGGVPLTRNLTINGTTFDLSADRTWNVGTVTSVGLSAGTGISIGGTNPITSSGTITVTNTAPDQIVALTAGTGIAVSGAYPNFTITNTATATSGRFGIADSNGVYTYYTTLTLAMAAAVAGQTIEFFTDYNETGAVTITLKDGVNINMNGHTYTHSYSAGAITAFSGTSVKLAFTNGQIVLDCGFISSIGLQLSGSVTSLDCSGLTIQVISAGGTGKPLVSTGGTVRYLRAESIDDLCASAVRTTLFNCYFTATNLGGGLVLGSSALGNVGTAYDCYVKTSSGTGIRVNVNSNIINCNVDSNSGVAVDLRAGTVSNGKLLSSSNYALVMDTEYSTGLHASGSVDNANIISGSTTVIMAAISTANNYLRGCTISSSSNAIEISPSSLTLNNYILNNAVVAGGAFNCIYGSVANTKCVYANNTFHQSTTPISANIVQDIVNTQDNQGNILV